MAAHILILLLCGLVVVSLTLHYGLALFDLLPQTGGSTSDVTQQHFSIDYEFFLNLLFLGITAVLAWFWKKEKMESITIITTMAAQSL